MAGLEVSPDVHIYDDVLDSPGAYRAAALAYEFQTFDVGGSSWRGFASCQETELIDWLRAMRPDLTPTLSLFRKSPYGQIEPNFVHTDRNMGDWTLLYYLASAPEAGQVLPRAAQRRKKPWHRRHWRGTTVPNGNYDNTSRRNSIVPSCSLLDTSTRARSLTTTAMGIRPGSCRWCFASREFKCYSKIITTDKQLRNRRLCLNEQGV